MRNKVVIVKSWHCVNINQFTKLADSQTLYTKHWESSVEKRYSPLTVSLLLSIGSLWIALHCFSQRQQQVYLTSDRSVLVTQEALIYLELMIRIWANMGLDFAIFSTDYFILIFFMANYAFLWRFPIHCLWLNEWFNMSLTSDTALCMQTNSLLTRRNMLVIVCYK